MSIKLPPLIAHRGASAQAPENTLIALRKAYELGASWVEFDVRLASCGEAIIFHDATLGGTTSGTGHVKQTPYDTIASLDAGSWFAKRYAGEQVPTLAQWLQQAATFGMGINLEIKGARQDAANLAQRIAAALKAHWSKELPIPLVSAQSIDCLQAMQQLLPELHYGWVTDFWLPDWEMVLKSFAGVSLHINYQELTAARVEKVHAAGKQILAYTVNQKEQADMLFAMGVNAIFSDDPQLLQAG